MNAVIIKVLQLFKNRAALCISDFITKAVRDVTHNGINYRQATVHRGANFRSWGVYATLVHPKKKGDKI